MNSTTPVFSTPKGTVQITASANAISPISPADTAIYLLYASPFESYSSTLVILVPRST
jgi:hypothetical protein